MSCFDLVIIELSGVVRGYADGLLKAANISIKGCSSVLQQQMLETIGAEYLFAILKPSAPVISYSVQINCYFYLLPLKAITSITWVHLLTLHISLVALPANHSHHSSPLAVPAILIFAIYNMPIIIITHQELSLEGGTNV